MSKICGIISENLNKYQIQPLLYKMANAMKHEDWHRIDLHSEDGIGLGHLSIGAVNDEPQPIFNPTKRKMVISAGKIFDYQDKKCELIKKGYRFILPDNDAEFILNLNEERGTDYLKKFNGIFAYAFWDSGKKELIIANDRHGFRPLYYYFEPGRKLLLFASEIKAITIFDFVNKEVNWEAWNIFLRLGFLVGEDTFFKNINTLPPASMLHYEGNNIRIETYWNYTELKFKDKFDENEDIDNLIFLFRQSIKRRLMQNKKVAVFLSGGLDSRGIAAELRHQGQNLTSFTTRKFSPKDYDRPLANLVAKSLNIDNQFYDLPKDFLSSSEGYKNFILDYESDEHAWLMPLLKSLPQDIKINYDGIGQDIICEGPRRLYEDSNFNYFRLLCQEKYEEFIMKWIIKKYSFLNIPIKNTNNAIPFLSKRLKQYFSNEVFLTKIKNELNFYKWAGPHAFCLFIIRNRIRREIALSPFQLILNKLESFCPYFDNDYFEYAMSLPITAKWNSQLRKKIIKRAYPELSQIPTDLISIYKNEYLDIRKNYYSERLQYLLQCEKKILLNMNSEFFRTSYIFPRYLYDFIRIKVINLILKKPAENLLDSSHDWFTQSLHFLNSWILLNNITNSN